MCWASNVVVEGGTLRVVEGSTMGCFICGSKCGKCCWVVGALTVRSVWVDSKLMRNFDSVNSIKLGTITLPLSLALGMLCYEN